ncbi:MAG TPA: signal peptidase I [Verrucomicrobiae bacterium]|nr:signal peptidase I [Verrucomicrobiae bacterium]
MMRRLFSRTIREAVAMRKHVQRLFNAQRDLLKPEGIGAIQAKINELNLAIAANENDGKIRIKTEELQFAAEKWIKTHPHPVWRENVEVLLVAIAVAMGIRTFFLQPFKIPTGSMQPTLYGVTSTPDFSSAMTETAYIERFGPQEGQVDRLQKEVRDLAQAQKDLVIPTGWERIKEWFQGISYLHVVAKADGTVDSISPMRKFLIFNIKQSFTIGGVEQTIWFPPDFGESDLRRRAGILPGRVYHKGEDIVKIRVRAGDHLFVDRLTYNFRPPKRGDIVVFETKGIPEDRRRPWGIPDNEFYIKRLCGLGGETISLHQDYEITGVPQPPPLFGNATEPAGNLVINGNPITASTPKFENLYTFYGATNGATTLPYVENHYYGHALVQGLASGSEVQIPPKHFFVMGDNTMNSLDSRYWGDFPSDAVIGKSFFVYWPLTRRFGWGND